jgi:N-acetylglucosamine transport system substrate-binding protein
MKTKRREFLWIMGGMTASAILAACAPKAEPTPTPAAPAEVPATPAEVPATPAEAPTVTDPSAGGGYPPNFVARSASWQRLPSDHVKGTLVTEEEWFEILGPQPDEVEAAFWLEGWGHGWIREVIGVMQETHPGININLWGDPRIWETLRPRLVDGDIPDVGRLWITGGQDAQIAGVRDGVYVPVDFLLDVEAYGHPGERLEERLVEGSLAGASMGLGDAQWALPLVQSFRGIYYNLTMFEENGWPRPDELTWEEFMELHQEIKDAGIAPWTYQGQYPGYWNMIIEAMFYKKGGQEALCDIDHLVEGAWKNPDILWSIEQIQRIFAESHIFPGAEAMSHTEGQQIFMESMAAMVPCGNWLEREMEETTPEGFRMGLSSVPAPADAKGFEFALGASPGGSELVVGNGQNPLWGMEFARHVFSPQNARYVAEQVGGLISVKGALDDAEDISEALQSGLDAVERAEGHYPRWWFTAWYPTMGKVWGDNIGDMLWGRISAEEITDMMERAASEVRADATIEKPTRPDC